MSRFVTLRCFSLLSCLLFFTGEQVWGTNAVETPADRRLLAIVEEEQKLQERAAAGAGEETLLLMAQEIASRYEQFLADNPNHPYGWILAGRFLRNIGNDTLALAAFFRAEENTPGQAVVQQQIGQILAENGDYELALPYFLQAIELAPKEATYHEDMGLFLVSYGKLLEVDGVLESGRAEELRRDAFDTARQLEPDNFDRWWRWAESYTDRKEPDWPGSIKAWEKTLEQAKTTIQKEGVWLQLARSNLMAGNKDSAEKWLNKEITTPALQQNWETLREQYKNNAFE